MKNILITTDFSACANAAAEYGIQLGQMSGAKINFFHLLETHVDWVKLPKEKEKLYPDTLRAISFASSNLVQWVDKAKNSNVRAKNSLVYVPKWEELFLHIKDRNHDFLVMGSNGSKGLLKKIIGSNAQFILRNATVPVLIIKKPIKTPVKNIVFVSDFRDVSRASFHTLTDFADVLEAHIDLLFINTPGQFEESAETSQNMDRVMTHCNREDSCSRNVINATSIEEGIKEFTVKKSMDLIAICTHGKSGLQRLFSSGIAEKVANQSILPVLSIKL